MKGVLAETQQMIARGLMRAKHRIYVQTLQILRVALYRHLRLLILMSSDSLDDFHRLVGK